MGTLNLILPVLMSFLNRMRGSGTPKWVPILRNYGTIAAVGFALIVFVFTLNPIAALAAGLAYFVGELFAWGKWIGAMPHVFDRSWQVVFNTSLGLRKDGRDNGIHVLGSLISKQEKNFALYSIACLSIRGIYWWAPVLAVLVGFGIVQIIPAVIAALAFGIAFPVSFILSSKINKAKFWEYGEIGYGFAQGVILALLL